MNCTFTVKEGSVRRLSFLVALLLLPLFTQAGQRGQPADGTFDPRDLSGIWLRQGGDRSISTMPPPFTPAGQDAAKQNVISGTSRSQYIRADRPELSNDPVLKCNPKGFPRIVLDTADDYHEVVMLPNRIIQLWQYERRSRDIWTDGRDVPAGESLDNLGPAWYGHSVGRWEGDLLVVTTVGLDERTWVDAFGFPMSPQARVEERYRRVDRDTLELRMTLSDPQYYTAPWVSDVKTWKKQNPENLTRAGWSGLFSGASELICAPLNGGPVSRRN